MKPTKKDNKVNKDGVTIWVFMYLVFMYGLLIKTNRSVVPKYKSETCPNPT